ncbi:MAG: hypothetical protein IT447_14955 [Phycisphaerales bacterium]|jgi:hypothetical protein|nr:hypothetical protein [Phycisphaerales bacterium]
MPLTIIVGGYIVGYPLGGMTWHHLNYLLGLQEMGHEVWFLEDSGSYSMPYNPAQQRCDPDPTYGLDYLRQTFAHYGLPLRYCYYSQYWDTYYGLQKQELNDLLGRADLMICVSGVTPIRPQRPRPRRMIVIDTDPVFTQLRMGESREFLDYYRSFDQIATFAMRIGQKDCPLPTHGIDWIPTCQPIALRHWPVIESTSRTFTTIGKWEHGGRDVKFNDKTYHSSKSHEWMKLIDLPSRVPWQMELAMQAMPAEAHQKFTAHGWSLVDPEPASISTQAFARYIQDSAGEFTVAKEIYAGLPSGWFSDRGVAFLASGRPVVTQESGFGRWLPTGEGLIGFSTPHEAADALQRIADDYPRHAQAARRIAEMYFDARKILTELLERSL